MTHARILGVALALGSFTVPSASAQVYERIDVGNQGELGNHSAEWGEMSEDGRYVVFDSTATNLGSPVRAVYVRDRVLATTTVIGMPAAPGYYRNPRMSGDGSTITFSGGPDETRSFVHHRVSGVTTEILLPGLVRLSVTALDRTGAYAAFMARSTTTGPDQVYRLHLPSGTVVLCSKNPAGTPVGGVTGDIDAGGNLVVFASASSAIVPNDSNGATDVFAYDVAGNVMQRVSLTSTGGQATGADLSQAVVDASGRYVAFSSSAANLVPNDNNNRTDVFVRDLLLGTTALVSLNSAQGQFFQGTFNAPTISGDGTSVAFSRSEPIAPLDVSPNSSWDVFMRDTMTGTLHPVSTGSSVGAPANVRGMGFSFDGREVLLASEQPGMTQLPRLTGIFIAKFGPRCSTTNYCTSGANSTGKAAAINTRGIAGKARNDFMVGGVDLPLDALTLLVSGTGAIDPGMPFGNGQLCIGGTLVRHGASVAGGGIVLDAQDLYAPEYAGVHPGDTLYYQMFYRDPAAGGQMFNTTDAVEVTFCW